MPSAELVAPEISFSGSRKFSDRHLVEEVIRRLLRRYPGCTFSVGDADGLDELVYRECRRLGLAPRREICHWPPSPSTRQERWYAAHERNERVVLPSNMLIAMFADGPRSPGTSDAIAIARRAGKPVTIYHEGRWTRE